ncbi:MAG: GGDEF domain-containing protein [Methylotenera sp.]|nr:GGDEF domain-containing protein [Methylotenera sp.]
MTNSKQSKSALAPLDIARETFKQMAVRRIEPTPDNYLLIYNEIAGTTAKETLDSAFKRVLKSLPHETAEQGKWVNRWEKLLKQNNWDALPALLGEGMDTSVNFSTQWPDAIRDLLKAWDAKQTGLDLPRKKEALERVLINFGNDPLLAKKIQTIASSWQEYGVTTTIDSKAIKLVSDEMPVLANLVKNVPEDLISNDVGIAVVEPDKFQEAFRTLQDMLRQALNHGLIPRLDGYPELKEDAQKIAILADSAKKIKDWYLVAKQFRALLVRVELIGANENGIKQDLLHLLKLLVDNISELVADDQWVRGQIAVVQTIITSPLERAMIQDAEKSLKEVIFKQGTLKHSLTEAKHAFKHMIATFVDRLGHMSTSSATYQEKIEIFSGKLAETEDISQINALLENLMKDTQTMQTDIVRSREDLLNQRDQVDASQEKILKLQEELSQLSEKVSIDQLTGVLNRRGLDDAMVREIARAQRGGSQLCLALLDIDNFKHFNDTYGHHVGDTALQHLAKVIQDTVRPTDITARFGGEEFVILLPDTAIEQAVETISRLQRALTKQFFLGNNERLLITFSAGVSLFNKDEEPVSVLNRADQAMYLAKKTGKNRVMTEIDLFKVKK